MCQRNLQTNRHGEHATKRVILWKYQPEPVGALPGTSVLATAAVAASPAPDSGADMMEKLGRQAYVCCVLGWRPALSMCSTTWQTMWKFNARTLKPAATWQAADFTPRVAFVVRHYAAPSRRHAFPNREEPCGRILCRVGHLCASVSGVVAARLLLRVVDV